MNNKNNENDWKNKNIEEAKQKIIANIRAEISRKADECVKLFYNKK